MGLFWNQGSNMQTAGYPLDDSGATEQVAVDVHIP